MERGYNNVELATSVTTAATTAATAAALAASKAVVESTVALLSKDIAYIKEDISTIKSSFKDMSNAYVTHDEFNPVKTIAYGMIPILVASLGILIITYVLKK